MTTDIRASENLLGSKMSNLRLSKPEMSPAKFGPSNGNSLMVSNEDEVVMRTSEEPPIVYPKDNSLNISESQ